MLSPRRSTASTRPRSFVDSGYGGPSRRSSSPPSNGPTGSTIAGCWSPSATFRRPKPRHASAPRWKPSPWPRDSSKTASDKPGAVHSRHAIVRPSTRSGLPVSAPILVFSSSCKCLPLAGWLRPTRLRLSTSKDAPPHKIPSKFRTSPEQLIKPATRDAEGASRSLLPPTRRHIACSRETVPDRGSQVASALLPPRPSARHAIPFAHADPA